MTEMAVDQAGRVEVKSMTKAERRELRRIVARRFKLLKEQLSRRQMEIERALKEQMSAERAASVEKVTKKLSRLAAKQNKLADEYGELMAEAGALGVSIMVNTSGYCDVDGFRGRYGRDPVVADVSADVSRRIFEIQEEAGWGKLSLSELEWQLDEQLAVGELESGSSKEFLAALPTPESLMPLPAGITLPEIEA